VSEDDVKKSFSGCSVSNIRWLERDGQFKGVGFVEFADTTVADKAWSIAQNGVKIGGRDARIDWAADKRK